MTGRGDGTDAAGLRIAISGASGFIGSRLAPCLAAQGYRVLKLVRRPAEAEDEIYWDPTGGEFDPSALENLRAVVHLAGRSIAAGRWTPALKADMYGSRVAGTLRLSETLAFLDAPPAMMLCASGTGYYGDAGEEVVTEESAPGNGFLAELCQAWEAATQPAAEAGIRVVNLRIAPVLSATHGMLAAMLRPFRLGLGGPVGSGRQYMSWIATEDLLAAVCEAITNPGLSGPVNAASPEPVTNAGFAQALAKVLGKSVFMRVPAWAVRLALGEMGRELLLQGQRVRPAKLMESGFNFRHPQLEEALRHELHGERS